MVTKEYEIDVNLLNALTNEISRQELPVQVQTGLPFTSECGNQVMAVQIDCADDYEDKLGELISQVINRIYCLT